MGCPVRLRIIDPPAPSETVAQVLHVDEHGCELRAGEVLARNALVEVALVLCDVPVRVAGEVVGFVSERAARPAAVIRWIGHDRRLHVLLRAELQRRGRWEQAVTGRRASRPRRGPAGVARRSVPV